MDIFRTLHQRLDDLVRDGKPITKEVFSPPEDIATHERVDVPSLSGASAAGEKSGKSGTFDGAPQE
jgi:hypothetical protein